MAVLITYTQNRVNYKMLIDHAVAFGFIDYAPEPDDKLLVAYDKQGKFAGGGYLIDKENAKGEII